MIRQNEPGDMIRSKTSLERVVEDENKELIRERRSVSKSWPRYERGSQEVKSHHLVLPSL
jgi:hypothetical protein